LQKTHKITNKSDGELYQPHVVAVFSLVGMSILATMAVIALFNQTYILAVTLFGSSLLFFMGYYVYKKFNNSIFSSAIVLYSLYSLMFYLVYTGGVAQTGPLWIFIIPPISLFIQGLKYGLVNIAMFVAVISIIMFIPTDVMTHAPYSMEFKLRLLYSFLTVTALSALYEYSRERSYKSALRLSEKYQQLANFDPLTQLSNRRGALAILQQEQARISRKEDPLSIILCDIDYFKKVNDLYGHNAGDAILIALAKIFMSNMREQDSIARWGGEEFLFILPQTTAANANVVAEKIRGQIQNHTTFYQDKAIKVTSSMGIEQFDGTKSIDEVINSADKHLYKAKDAGRNQVFPKLETTDDL
jgi:diguanylate cyclase (GGDEF)-like protein